MSKILDDHEFDLIVEKPKKEEPMKVVGLIGLVIFLALFAAQLAQKETSETALVTGSYFWMPFLVMGVLGFILPPKKAIFAGILTVPVTFIFYMLIWSSL
jgi:hypothetical protein